MNSLLKVLSQFIDSLSNFMISFWTVYEQFVHSL